MAMAHNGLAALCKPAPAVFSCSTARYTIRNKVCRFTGCQRREVAVRASSSKEGAYERQDQIKKARQKQLQTSQLLAKLLEVDDPRPVAAQYVDSLTEEFFHVSSMYLDMARKEGNAQVFGRLESTLKVAMEEKNKTLRPEIQLLNKLLGITSGKQRKQILLMDEWRPALTADNKYFFTLLERMTRDVDAQPSSPRQLQLQVQLKEIRKEALAACQEPEGDA